MAERALNAIITDINTQVKTVSFGSKITTRGLCYQQEKDGKTFPVENVNTKNANKISWDDKYPLQVYHRITAPVEKETDRTKGFGNKASLMRVYQMRLVGIGKKASLSVAAYEDNQEICKAIEAVLPAFVNTNEYLEISSMEVDKNTVYEAEFPGIDMKKLSLEGIAFWIDYTIKINDCGAGRSFTSTSTVRNTDSTYNTTVNCKQTLVVPDITITKLDDTTATLPAAKNLDAANYVGTMTWAQMVAIWGIGYNYPQPTGQTTVYRTGDDASIEATVFTAAVRAANGLKPRQSLANFSTLNNNNAFGNTNRFTDDAGGQTYANNYLIDHYTGLGWYRLGAGIADWNTAIDTALASTAAGYSSYFLPNLNIYQSIWQFLSDPFSSIITNLNGADDLFTSTTNPNNTNQCYRWTNMGSGGFTNILKSSGGQYYIICRKHY